MIVHDAGETAFPAGPATADFGRPRRRSSRSAKGAAGAGKGGYNPGVRFLYIAVIVLAAGCGGSAPAPGHTAAADSGPQAGPGAPHLIYLHGRIIEDRGPRPTHPRFGVYEFQRILDTFTGAGLEVTGEQRPAGTVPAEAARSVAGQVRRLIAEGVPPERITVVGFSKGGVIAVLSALELDDPRVNYVFIACCGDWTERLFAGGDRRIRGRMLSIHEASDAVGGCDALFAHASSGSETAAIELELGGGHGAFYRPHPEWIDPVVRWARRESVARDTMINQDEPSGRSPARDLHESPSAASEFTHGQRR